ncbi:MAG TPA: magnesium transporter [Fimbriiglobus sp.]
MNLPVPSPTIVPRMSPAVLAEPVLKHAKTDLATLRPQWTVADSLAHIRSTPPANRIIYFYVTDEDRKLAGVVPTRRLLLSPPETRITEIMIKSVVAIPANATVLDACEFFTFHRLLAFPVVDTDRRLLGAIDVDLYTAELTMESDESVPRDDLFQLIGVHLSTATQRKPTRAARDRFPWLLCNIGGGLAAAILSGFFEDVLSQRNAVFALFIPVVLALAESVSIQSVSLGLQRMASNRLDARRLLRDLAAETYTGVLLGIGSAILIGLVAGLWLHDRSVVLVLVGGIAFGVTAAAAIGFAIPALLRATNREPRLAAGPIALALADFTTLLAYFNLARISMN